MGSGKVGLENSADDLKNVNFKGMGSYESQISSNHRIQKGWGVGSLAQKYLKHTQAAKSATW